MEGFIGMGYTHDLGIGLILRVTMEQLLDNPRAILLSRVGLPMP